MDKPNERGVTSARRPFSISPRQLIQHTPAALMVGVFVFTLIVALQHYGRTVNSQTLIRSSGDYGNYAEIARVYANGGRMYADYWTTKPPGMFFVLTPFVLLFGNTIFAIYLATLLIMLVFVAATTALAYRLTDSNMAALMAASFAMLYTTFEDGPETTLLMSTLGVCAMLCVVVGRGRMAWMVGAGALFGAGALAKQPILIEIPVLVAFAVHYAGGHRARAVLGVLVGGAALALLVIAWALSQGILDDMWARAFALNAQYVVAQDGRWHFSDSFWDLFNSNFVYETFPYLRGMLLIGVAALIVLAKQPRWRALLLIVLAWVALALVGGSAGRAFKASYFFQTIPPLIMLGALGVAAVQRGTRGQWLMALVMVAAVASFQVRFGRFSATRLNGKMPDERPVIAYIQAHTPADSCIWTWGHISFINYLSGRDSCSSAAINAFMMDETAFPIVPLRVEYMHELIDRVPSLHVLSNEWGYFPELEKYAERYLGAMVYENERYKLYEVDRAMWHPTRVVFGGEIALIGYDLLPVQTAYCPGDVLTTAMTWEQLRPPARAYHLFTQLLTPDEQAQIAGYDGQPEHRRPTDTWTEPHEIVLGDQVEITIPPDTAPGVYRLVSGLYAVESGTRLDVLDANGQPVGTYAVLQDVTVEACE